MIHSFFSINILYSVLIFCFDDKLLVCDMTKAKGIGQRKKDGKEKKENIDSKISQEIEKLENDIRTKSSEILQSSKNYLVPSCK